MVEALPKWMMVRYAVLYRKFKKMTFNRQQARAAFKASGLKEEEKLSNVFFSQLQKKGWVTSKKDSKDTRMKTFRLISPEEAIKKLKLED